MKAFFHRLHIGSSSSSTKDKDRDRDKDKDSSLPKEKFPPLPQWPPVSDESHSHRVPSYPSFKPLPQLLPEPLASQLPSRSVHDSHSESSSIPLCLPISPPSLLSPPPPPTLQVAAPGKIRTQTPLQTYRRRLPSSPRLPPPLQLLPLIALFPTLPPQPLSTTTIPSPATPAPAPATTILPLPLPTPPSHLKPPSPASRQPMARSHAAPCPPAVPPPPKWTFPLPPQGQPSRQLLLEPPLLTSTRHRGRLRTIPRSGTPYSQMSQNTSGSRILAAASWSEVTEDDLVSNIGSRERTRQEVLFEIISSEERYVQELVKMKDTFIDPLLHPFSTPAYSTSPTSSTPHLDYDYYRSESPFESTDDLPPIAARFMSPTPPLSPPPTAPSTSGHTTKTAPNIDGDSLDTDEEDELGDQAGRLGYPRRAGPASSSKHNHPRSPYRATATRTPLRTGGTSVPFPSRSHHSLPPPRRGDPPMTASMTSLGRQSIVIDQRERSRNTSQGQETPARAGVLKKFRKNQTAANDVLGDAIAPNQLPEDLRICLEVIDSGVFDGHKRLSEALKKRYDDQFPLVRSLADVFVSNSDIFHGYATYVLHLERALEQVDAALSNVSTKKPKKQDAGEWQKVCKFLQKLEENACEKGETGLAITLSKPFQRLLKYPLLFQNLLFHTDPSTFEYESTLQMVAEVETIVRSIEDEKIQKEERDKTRDVFARIEGLDKVRQLALPKPSRVLIEERPCGPSLSQLNGSPKSAPSSPPAPISSKGIRGKSSFKRLSDVLYSGGIGGKKDLWFVVFNDVVLQCQRTGTTSLPLVATTSSRTNSLPDLQGKSKYATTGRRNSYTKPRNLYKFIKIEKWDMRDIAQPREGVVSMDDVVRSRAHVLSNQPRIVPLPDDDEDNNDDSDDSDKKSKMSFSYWGADKVTVQKPIVKGKTSINPRRHPAAAFGRESSANAKFGTRLVSDGSPTPRPASRRTYTATPTSRRPATTDEGPNYAKATVTRPAWDTSTSRSAVPAISSKRSRNTSQASAATRTAAGAKPTVASPAPSEDSGVGLYRQMLANDPSLNNNS
ncbi:hypothetical protein BDQ17DRAFT_1353396 [Cyathus striatus]|nr:hypothetical protein BDQ17DRAFT_1353396 [Cyathus striatus]